MLPHGRKPWAGQGSSCVLGATGPRILPLLVSASLHRPASFPPTGVLQAPWEWPPAAPGHTCRSNARRQ